MTKFLLEFINVKLLGRLRYIRAEHYLGGWFIATPAQADEFLANMNPVERREYTCKDVYLSPAELESAADFVGF
jgi:hypothetical protein